MQLYAGGRFEEAIVVATQAVELGTTEFGANHPSTAALISNLADLHTELDRWSDAERLYRQVATISIREPRWRIIRMSPTHTRDLDVR